jgi:hypothetical protein
MAVSCAPCAGAGNYIARLPRAERDAPAWRAAIQALMLVADTMMPRISIMRALYRNEKPAPTTRKKRAKKY